MSTSNIKIFGNHIDITPALETNIKNMIAKLRQKFDHITNVNITLKIDSTHSNSQQAEAELFLCGKKEPIFAKANSADMYDSLHKLKDKLDRQILKHKEILHNHGDDRHHHHNHSHDYDCSNDDSN